VAGVVAGEASSNMVLFFHRQEKHNVRPMGKCATDGGWRWLACYSVRPCLISLNSLASSQSKDKQAAKEFRQLLEISLLTQNKSELVDPPEKLEHHLDAAN
jgi:hypothetical protein